MDSEWAPFLGGRQALRMDVGCQSGWHRAAAVCLGLGVQVLTISNIATLAIGETLVSIELRMPSPLALTNLAVLKQEYSHSMVISWQIH